MWNSTKYNLPLFNRFIYIPRIVNCHLQRYIKSRRRMHTALYKVRRTWRSQEDQLCSFSIILNLSEVFITEYVLLIVTASTLANTHRPRLYRRCTTINVRVLRVEVKSQESDGCSKCETWLLWIFYFKQDMKLKQMEILRMLLIK